MTWPSATIGDVCDVIPGFAFKSKDLGDVGYPVVKIGNITDDYRVDTEATQRFPEHLVTTKHEKFKLGDLDIVVAMTGATAGKVGRIRCSSDDTLLLNQRVAKLSPRAVNPDFFWSAISTPRYRQIFYSLGGGAAQPNMSGPQIESVQIPLPPPREQARIADTLSSYDDLIENNRRRIQLLEQAARLLYKEWFVHLRFPGHEHVKVVDGVPEGWERRELKDCISELETGNRPKGGVSNISEGVPSIGAESIVGVGQFDFGKTKYVPEHYFSRLRQGVVQDRDVLVYKDGGRPGHFTPHISMFGGGFPFDQMALNSHVYRARGIEGISQEFLYFHLSSDPMLSWMNKAGSGAAIPGIARKDLLRLPVLVPTNRLMHVFTESSASFITQILALALSTRKLGQARDLLLPRLMSGEIAV